MTIPTEIAMATFLAGFVGCVAAAIGMLPLVDEAVAADGGGWL